jgi:hypothetical protein
MEIFQNFTDFLEFARAMNLLIKTGTMEIIPKTEKTISYMQNTIKDQSHTLRFY